MKNNFNIRKSDFKSFKKCPKLMWLMRNRSNEEVKKWCKKNILFLNKEEQKKFESNFKYNSKIKQKVNSELEIRIINGIIFEKTVKKYFSKLYSSFNFEIIKNRFSIPIEKTEKILNNKKYSVFYHPTFKFDNYITECDLLKRNKDNSFDIYEIKGKGNSGIKTDKKDLINDLLYQKWLLNKLNIKIKNCYIVHLNSDYIYQKQLNLNELIKINDIFNFDKFLNKNIEGDLIDVEKWLNYSWKDIKEKIENNSFCQEETNNFCTYLIKKPLPIHNITQLYRMTRTNKGKILSENNFKDINLKNFNYTKYPKIINKKHLRQIDIVKNNTSEIENIEIAKNELKKYKYPIYFFDFETCPIAIPIFENSNVYQQIPFQFSIHILLNENYDLKTKKNIIHKEFIINSKKNPKIEFIKHFIKNITEYGFGTYVAYHIPFEKQIIKKILKNDANLLTKKEKNILETIIFNVIDLKDFFSNFNIYFKDFMGSLSIKYVLPSLDPTFSYKDLKIQSGDQALSKYYNYINNLISQEEWEKKITNNLKKYCGLDSLAMVVIFDKVKKIIN